MEREVRYCITSDGVDIAYWTVGAGAPLVYIPEPVLTASEADYRLPATRRWYEALADGRMLVRFDHRGTGLSHHNDDFTLEALVRDLEAVVDKLGLPTFDLWGDMDGGIVAVAYAAAHPERVRRLVLFNSWARAADVPESETLQTLDRLIGLNWPLYARTAATMDSGWTSSEALEYAGYLEDGCEPAVARAFVDATWEYDVTPMLGQIACPTLVIHRRGHKYFPLSLGRTLAAGISGARLTAVEGESFYPWFEHADNILRTALAFLGEGADAGDKRGGDGAKASSRRAPTGTQRSGDGEVRYCTTADGVGLAYAVSGAGPMVIFVPAFISFPRVTGGAQVAFTEVLAGQFRVVRYDLRGMGLSDRTAMDYSLETRVADVLAIADWVGAERFSLVGESWAAPVALAFAARYPERVDKLVVRDPFANGARFYAETNYGKVAMATTDLTVEQWEFISQTITARGAPEGSTAEDIKVRAEAFRASWDPDGVLAFREGNRQVDIATELADVQAPTLVVQTSDERAIQQHVREVMARLPNARLVVDPGGRGGLREIVEFLGGSFELPATEAKVGVAASGQGEVQTIVFTDIEANTELLQRLGDERWRALLREHEAIIRAELVRFGGAEIKTMGDAFMASFGSAARALECAVAMQRALTPRPPLPPAGEGESIRVRIGINAGEPIAENDDLYGTSVTMASRIQGLAKGGEVLVSDVVRQLVAGKGFLFSDRGEVVLRGFEDPVRVWELRWGSDET